MSTTRELHEKAMDVYEQALIAARNRNARLTRRLLDNALRLESEAADSVADNYLLEPTRSILHRSAATIALKAGNIETARKYADAGLREALHRALPPLHGSWQPTRSSCPTSRDRTDLRPRRAAETDLSFAREQHHSGR